MTAALAGVAAYLVLGTLAFLGRGRWLGAAAWLAGAGALAAWAPGFPETALGPGPWPIRLAGDPVALAFWGLALVLHAAVLWEEWGRGGAFHALVTLLVGTTLALVLSRDLFNLYVCLELTSLLSFLLVGYEARPGAIWASLQYLLLTTAGMILYLFGLGLVYGETGTLALSELAGVGPSPALVVGAGLLLSGAAVKGGVFLLGLWLPRAHGRAPHAVSALLSGLVVKMGIVALFRISSALGSGPILAGLGVLTGLGGLIYALWEVDIKYFLAFSTASQLGYLLLGFGLGAPLGATLYAVGHGLFKALLFLGAGKALESAGSRRIPDLAGRLGWPVALALGLGIWSISGLPPLAGFVAKGALEADLPAWGRWLLLAIGAGTAASFAKLLPLLQPVGEGRLKGELVLIPALVALSGWGLASFHLTWAATGKAVAAAALGLILYPLLRRARPRLPRLTLDRAVLGLLAGTLGLTLALVWSRLSVP